MKRTYRGKKKNTRGKYSSMDTREAFTMVATVRDQKKKADFQLIIHDFASNSHIIVLDYLCTQFAGRRIGTRTDHFQLESTQSCSTYNVGNVCRITFLANWVLSLHCRRIEYSIILLFGNKYLILLSHLFQPKRLSSLGCETSAKTVA